MDKRSTDYILRSGLAGGLAGVSAKTLIAPLDRVKILFQTNNPHYKRYVGSFRGMFAAISHIYAHDGLLGLYQGHSATLLRIFPYAAIKFVAYEQLRNVLIPDDIYETAGRRLLAGSLAGVVSVFFTYPLDLVRVRLAFETHRHTLPPDRPGATGARMGKIWHILNQIYSERPRFTLTTGGAPRTSSAAVRLFYNLDIPARLPVVAALSNFYRGFVPTILGMVPYAGVSFYTHDLLHDVFRSEQLAKYTVLNYDTGLMAPLGSLGVGTRSGRSAHNTSTSAKQARTRPPLTTWAQLLAGGAAGMLAQAAAYPFEVIRRRMQVGAIANTGGEFYGVSRTVSIIYAERGLAGFYVGLGIGFLKVVPMFACSFYVYERCKIWLHI